MVRLYRAGLDWLRLRGAQYPGVSVHDREYEGMVEYAGTSECLLRVVSDIEMVKVLCQIARSLLRARVN